MKLGYPVLKRFLVIVFLFVLVENAWASADDDIMDSQVYYELGVMYSARSDPDDAVYSLEKAVELSPEFTRGHYLLQKAYEALRDNEMAEYHQKRRGDIPPEKLHIYELFEKGLSHFARGEYEKARAPLEELLSKRPDFTRCRFMLANTYVHIGEIEKALSHFEKILAINPRNEYALYNVAKIYCGMGKTEKAEALLIRLCEGTQRQMPYLAPYSDYFNTSLSYIGFPILRGHMLLEGIYRDKKEYAKAIYHLKKSYLPFREIFKQADTGSGFHLLIMLLNGGKLTYTGRALDASIEEAGSPLFFLERLPDGSTCYIRSISLCVSRDSKGRSLLTTSRGLPVLDKEENCIIVPQDYVSLYLEKDGSVMAMSIKSVEKDKYDPVTASVIPSYDEHTLGRICLAKFSKPEGLNYRKGAFTATGDAGSCRRGYPGEDGFPSLNIGFQKISEFSRLDEKEYDVIMNDCFAVMRDKALLQTARSISIDDDIKTIRDILRSGNVVDKTAVARLHGRLGALLAGKGDAAFFEEYREALNGEPENPFTLYNLGYCLAESNSEEAAVYLQKSLSELAKGRNRGEQSSLLRSRAERLLAMILLNSGNKRDAEVLLEDALFQEGPERKEGCLPLAVIYRHNPDNSAIYLQEFLKRSFVKTECPLDIAIAGKGYFSLESPKGVFLTRDGKFTLKGDRDIVTAEGYSLGISLPPAASDITVTEDGWLQGYQNNKPVNKFARICITNLPDKAAHVNDDSRYYKVAKTLKRVQNFPGKNGAGELCQGYLNIPCALPLYNEEEGWRLLGRVCGSDQKTLSIIMDTIREKYDRESLCKKLEVETRELPAFANYNLALIKSDTAYILQEVNKMIKLKRERNVSKEKPDFMKIDFSIGEKLIDRDARQIEYNCLKDAFRYIGKAKAAAPGNIMIQQVYVDIAFRLMKQMAQLENKKGISGILSEISGMGRMSRKYRLAEGELYELTGQTADAKKIYLNLIDSIEPELNKREFESMDRTAVREYSSSNADVCAIKRTACRNLASIYYKEGDLRDAERYYKEEALFEPALADVFARSGRYDEALRILKMSLYYPSVTLQNPDLQYESNEKIGDILISMGKPDRAMPYFEKARNHIRCLTKIGLEGKYKKILDRLEKKCNRR